MKLGKFVIFWLGLGVMLMLPHGGFSTALPKSTREILKKHKLHPSILAGVDKELRVPQEWLRTAEKEGRVRVLSPASPSEAVTLSVPFRERYPFISVDHAQVSQRSMVEVLQNHKAGRVVTDIIFGIGGTLSRWKEADALADLRNIPGVKKLRGSSKDPGGLWVGTSINYWCMSYNTNLVKKEDLPKRWKDLLTNPRWREGKLALASRPSLWVLQLWKQKGERWTKDFLTKLFAEVKPQLRKEGLSALVDLVAAGEFHAVIPAMQSRVYQRVSAGASIGFHCPTPVPVSVGIAAIPNGAPHLNAARVYINWLLSSEGQISRWFAEYATPVRDDLVRRAFIPFADQILGKEMSFRNPGDITLPKVEEFWNHIWLRNGRKKVIR